MCVELEPPSLLLLEQEPTTITDSTPCGGVNALVRKCKMCRQILEALNDAGRKDARIKSSFARKDRTEQRDYMRNQKRKRESTAKRTRHNFDELIVEEETFTTVSNESRARIIFECYSDFEDRMMTTRRFHEQGKTKAEEYEQIKEEWKRLTTEDQDVQKEMVSGQICIKRFGGGFQDQVSAQGSKTSAKRRKVVTDANELAEVMKASMDRLQHLKQTHVNANITSGVVNNAHDGVQVV